MAGNSNRENFLNCEFLPERNSLGAILTFEVETFHIVKLLSRTTKFVVINFRNCVTKTSATLESPLVVLGRLELEF